MSNIVKVPVGQYVVEAMEEFGREVNLSRQLPSIYDGLKPVYRRMIFEAFRNPGINKTASLIGQCMATTHPHGDQSMKDVITQLVNWGVFKGHSNFGMKTIIGDDVPAAAARYTESELSDKYLGIIKDLMKYVPYVDAELKGVEPQFIPTPIPISLIYSTFGLGIGVNSRTPAFSVKSLFNAYLNDDPNLLEPTFDLDMDYSKSELDSLWTRGIGNITYKYRVSYGTSSGCNGVYIEGDPSLFKFRLGKIKDWITQGKVFITDESDRTGKRVFVGRNFNIKSISMDDIYNECVLNATKSRVYRLTVTDGEHAYLIPLKEWLSSTITSYLDIVETYRLQKLESYQFEYLVYTNLRLVADTFLADTNQEVVDIASKLNLDIKIVETILSKPINSLRKKDYNSKVESLKSSILEFESLNPNNYLVELINKF